jgi:hypothetical protein
MFNFIYLEIITERTIKNAYIENTNRRQDQNSLLYIYRTHKYISNIHNII